MGLQVLAGFPSYLAGAWAALPAAARALHWAGALLTLTPLQTFHRDHICACNRCWSLHMILCPLLPCKGTWCLPNCWCPVIGVPAVTTCDEALWIPTLSLAEGCSQPVLSRVRDRASRR